MESFCGPVAQLVEQLTFNQWVTGSNPVGLTSHSYAISTQIQLADETWLDYEAQFLMPLVTLLRLVHLRISGIALVPGRRRRRDDGGVNDTTLLQQDSRSAR